MNQSGFVTLSAMLVALTVSAAQLRGEEVKPAFEAETVDDQVQIGYGVAIGDVDGDAKPDILLADKKAFVWYRNPDWKRFVITEDLTTFDNVCIAARDIDGDGKVEIAVGAQWNPGDTLDSGSVHYLIPPKDRTQKWKPVQLHHEPTIHRMRWVKAGEERYVLVVAPLHGKGNRNGQGDGVKLLAYEVPDDPSQEWKTTLIDDSLHMTHNFDPCQWISDTPAEEILYIGREGAKLIQMSGDKSTAKQSNWTGTVFERARGGGEIRMGRGAEGKRFLTTIEPMHGNQLVVYPTSFGGKGSEEMVELNDRVVLSDSFKGGHAIATGDLIGQGFDQVVAGWRLPNANGKVGVKLFWKTDDGWQTSWIDDNGMATEDLRVADLDQDGKLDIIAAGRATKNLKIYWNKTE